MAISASPLSALRKHAGVVPPAAPATVLIVEDQPAVRNLVQTIMNMAGFQTFVAREPGEAFRIMAAHPFPIDLLITDMVMPGMNGQELAKTVQERWPEVKVLLMSGYDYGPESVRTRKVPSWAFLAKPFTPPHLLAAVEKLIGQDCF